MRIARTCIAALIATVMLANVAFAQRGTDGQLNIIYWQAVSILNPYLSAGTKDVEASSLILEPMANYDENGDMVPALAEAIPQVAADLRSITWKLRPGVVWSDGTPLTADDVVFTYDYCMHPEGGCQASQFFTDVKSVTKEDSLAVTITFTVAKPFPYGPFVGAAVPILQKAQFENCMGTRAPECTEQNFGPVGTGPFIVTDFRANDVITYAANQRYREPDRPRFASVVLKGGGDAASAARSVLETGEFDYAWNLQIEPEVMTKMEAAGRGKIIAAFGPSVERLTVNHTNPDPKLGGKRSTVAGGEHPFLADIAVRQALSLAIDRDILVEVGYGRTGLATCNILPAPAIYASTANESCRMQNIEEANRLLDDAGWKRGRDGVRQKDGVRLSILYQTSTNSVRQATQALVKQMWQGIGVETELRNVSASVFFGSDQSSPDTIEKFFADIEMFTNDFPGTDPEAYMAGWACRQIPKPENQWLGSNMPRFCNTEYDGLVAEMGKTPSIAERAVLAKRMNDLLVQNVAVIPLIHRGSVSARSLRLGGVKLNAWDSELWDVENWYRIR